MSSLTEMIGQLPVTCRILAVSKLQSEVKIRDLHSQGQRSFAENYVQEARAKQESLRDLKIDWHFIGQLQKNKAKDVVGRFALIHSVGSLEHARVLDQRASLQGVRQKILLQLNLALEETKGGFTEQQLETSWQDLARLKSVEIHGLMTMPPLFDDPERARPFFKKLRDWRDRLSLLDPNVKELSMGTSSDYWIAAEEGATWVRLGTILFGMRPRP